MTKTKTQDESLKSSKPKFQQTKLCFSAVPAKSQEQANNNVELKIDYTKKLEKSIQELKIGSSSSRHDGQHPETCGKCSPYAKRVCCTALKEDTEEPCNLSYCIECIESKVKENLEWIESNTDTNFVYKSGASVQHTSEEPKWACLVCRGLCNCKFCTKQSSPKPHPTSQAQKLSFNIKPTIVEKVNPPDLTPIDMLHSEEELWIRLQIREFVFRFGDLYNFDNRVISSLQNVQGDWRIKRFGAYIVWQFLVIVCSSSHFEFLGQSITGSDQETVQQMSKKIMHDWMVEKKIPNLYLDIGSRHQALLQVLNMEGMSGRKWQDIAELLALAEFRHIPVPTSRDLQHQEKLSRSEDDMELDDDEEEEEDRIQELEKKIRRFQKSTSRSLSILSSQDELKMINMLLELLLYDVNIRQSLVVAGQKSATTKEARDMELEFKKHFKEYLIEETRNKSKKAALTNRVSQLKAIRGKEEDLKQAHIELDALETLIRDERMNLETKRLELIVHAYKAEKRMKAVGSDPLGNEYWIFNDFSDHSNNATDYRNSEPFWAYGIIVIGPGFVSKGSDENKWWYLKGKKSMNQLMKWLKQQQDQEEVKMLIESIRRRMQYLEALEWVVYGEGFFS